MPKDIKLRPLSQRSLYGGSTVFKSWRKVALLLERPKADVYIRILKEGGATEITLLTMPFHRKELFAGVQEVEEIQFSHILSEPCHLQSDPVFSTFVGSNPANVHICSYLYLVECLCKVSFYSNKILSQMLYCSIKHANTNKI